MSKSYAPLQLEKTKSHVTLNVSVQYNMQLRNVIQPLTVTIELYAVAFRTQLFIDTSYIIIFKWSIIYILQHHKECNIAANEEWSYDINETRMTNYIIEFPGDVIVLDALDYILIS